MSGSISLRRAEIDRKVYGLTRVAQTVEPTGLVLAAGPGEHACEVELAVAGMEATPHHPGRKFLDRKGAHAALHLTVDVLVRHDVDLPGAYQPTSLFNRFRQCGGEAAGGVFPSLVFGPLNQVT